MKNAQHKQKFLKTSILETCRLVHESLAFCNACRTRVPRIKIDAIRLFFSVPVKVKSIRL